MKNIRKITKSDNAVVGIVATFLIVGLVVAIISVIQTVYIPKWMEQSEAEHMETVTEQFSQLKFAIDTQSAIKQKDTPISTPITLGSKELPFLMSSRAYGFLDLYPDECTVTIDDSENKTYSLGVIKYSSANAYYLNQVYIFEAGAVILSQSQGNTMLIKPAFSVMNNSVTSTRKNLSLSFSITNIKKIGGKRSIHGYGVYPIQTNYSKTNTIYITDIKNICINTNYRDAWQKFFKNTLINSHLVYSPDDYFSLSEDFSINMDNIDKVIVKFSDSINVDLTMNIIDIGVQIAPGLIENC